MYIHNSRSNHHFLLNSFILLSTVKSGIVPRIRHDLLHGTYNINSQNWVYIALLAILCTSAYHFKDKRHDDNMSSILFIHRSSKQLRNILQFKIQKYISIHKSLSKTKNRKQSAQCNNITNRFWNRLWNVVQS